MKLLIADDHDMVRETLAAFIGTEPDIDVTAVPDLDAACEAARRTLFDLILLDYSMPGMDGLAGLARAMEAGDGRPVAILSGTAPRAVAQDALDAGARGFLPKTMAARSLINAIRFMAMGETFVPVDYLTDAADAPAHPLAAQLTRRETEVLEALTRGLSNKEIGRELSLQEVTIKLHVKTMCRKLGVRNRTQAALLAKEQGLF